MGAEIPYPDKTVGSKTGRVNLKKPVRPEPSDFLSFFRSYLCHFSGVEGGVIFRRVVLARLLTETNFKFDVFHEADGLACASSSEE